jgi:hypothetical protein
VTRVSAEELLSRPDALLSRSHLRELGLERRAVDAVFRALPVVSLPGYSRPLVRVSDYLKLVERSTYRGERVRPVGGDVHTVVKPQRLETPRLQGRSSPVRAIGTRRSAA